MNMLLARMQGTAMAETLIGSPMLVAMKGHPGSGKSTLAAAISKSLRWPLVDKDDALDCLVLLGFSDSDAHKKEQSLMLNAVSYEIMWRVAETQLRLGLGAVVDCPLARPWLFKAGEAVAARQGVKMVVVECRPQNEDVWKARLEGRAEAALLDDMTGASELNSEEEEERRKKWRGASVRSLLDLPASMRWHKLSKWEELQRKIEAYDGCWDYDLGSVKKLTVDTTDSCFHSVEEIRDGVLDWLKSVTGSTEPVTWFPNYDRMS